MLEPVELKKQAKPLADFKPSSLGLIPMEWMEMSVEELVDSGILEKPLDGNHGNIHPTSTDFVSEGIPFIMANSVHDGILDLSVCHFLKREQADKLQKGFSLTGDVLLTHKGTVGNVTIVGKIPTDYIMLSPQVTYYRIKREEKLDRHYLKAFFESENFQGILKIHSGGGTRAYIGITNQRQLPILVPKIHEQKALAKLIGTWDKAIEKTTQLISAKEQRKKWLMQQLLTGKKRLKGFTTEWMSARIADIAEEISIKNKTDKELTVLSCTKYDGLVPSLEYFGRRVFGEDTSTYKVVPENHFAYATNHIEEGSIGYQGRFPEALISPMYTVFKTDDTVNDKFLYRVLKSHNYIHEYQKRMEGSIDRRGGLRWDEFSRIKIALPSSEEQNAIDEILQTADKEINLLKQKLEAYKEQKKGLMQVLLTGKVRLKI